MKIILHFGMGKTGSTSIQKFLENNISGLAANKVFYGGLMFERLPNVRFEWQDKSKAHDISSFLYALRDYENCELIRRYLIDEVAVVKSLEYKAILFSNEAFFDAPAVFHEFLYSAFSQYEFKVVVYLRRPIDWYVSAYLQWGIKHKTNKGKIKSFDEFVIDRKGYFQDNVEKIKKAWKDGLQLKIYEEGMDVLTDFLSIDCISFKSVGVKSKRENEKDSPSVIFLRYLVNNVEDSICLPDRFDKIFKSQRWEGSIKNFDDVLIDFRNLTSIRIHSQLIELINNEIVYWAQCTGADAIPNVEDMGDYLELGLKKTFGDVDKEELFSYLFRYFFISLLRGDVKNEQNSSANSN